MPQQLDLNDKEGDLLKKVRGFFIECRDFYGPANLRKAKDYDYYEGEQTWTREEEERREQEGKPTIRLNQINGVVDLIEGLERQTRLEIIAKGRTENDLPVADAYTKGIKYIGDQNKLDFKVSKAFSHAVKGGVGWLVLVRNPNPLQEEILIQPEGPFRIWVDPNFDNEDLSDARFVLYLKWVNIEVAKAMFPDKADELDNLIRDRRDYEDDMMSGVRRTPNGGTDYEDVPDFENDYLDSHRREVLIVECWHKKYETIHVMITPDDKRWELHPDAVKKDGTVDMDFLTQEQQVALTMQPDTQIVEGQADKMYLTMFTSNMVLWDGPSPYKHQSFPFIPIWAYKRRTGESYGVVRNLIGAQDEVNIHASQATHILNTVRVFMRKNSAMNRTQVAQEAARPDGIFEWQTPDDIKFERDEVALKDHIQLQQLRKEDIHQASGVNNELLGLQSDAKSGVAMRERQKQGTMRVTSIFDYLRMAKQMLGEQLISLMTQYWTPNKLARITEEMNFMERQLSPVGMVAGMDEHQPLNPEDIDTNQVRFSIIIEDTPAFGTYREQQLQMLTDMLQQMPFLAQVIAPDIVRATDLPDKEKLAQKLEIVSGLSQMGLAGGPTQQPMGAGPQGPMMPPQAGGMPAQGQDPMAQLNAYAMQLQQQGMPPEQIRQVIQQMIAGQQQPQQAA